MNAEEFVRRVRECAPKINDLKELGYTDDSAKAEQKCFACDKISDDGALENPLLDLIKRYDCSSLEIGLISFSPECYDYLDIDQSAYIPVAVMESDPVVVDKISGKILILDHGNLNFVMSTLADSGEKFLDSLIRMAEIKLPHKGPFDKLSELEKTNNNDFILKYAQGCARIAGISLDANIYEILLGYESKPHETDSTGGLRKFWSRIRSRIRRFVRVRPKAPIKIGGE